MNTYQDTADVTMRAEVALDEKLEELQIEQSELECPDIDTSHFHNKGVIINFFNPNTTAATQNIGGIRLILDDIRRIPAYLHKHRQRLRHLAVKFLDKHIRFAQCAIGAGERLTDDDYSLTWSVASLSEEGQNVWAGKRSEGPLYFCMYDKLTRPVHLRTFPDGTEDRAYLIHGYIALLPAGQRRTTALKRLGDELSPPPTLHPAEYVGRTSGGNQYKRPRNNIHNGASPPYNRNSNYQRGQPYNPVAPVVKERLDKVEKKVQELITRQLPNPPLPTSEAAPMWNQDGGDNGCNLPAV